MKNVKMYLSAFAILAIVSGALASNKYFGQGHVFCANTCTTSINFDQNDNGLSTKVCGTTAGVENTEYHLIGTTCTAYAAGLKYSSTQAGK